jgi:hypothetical protein
MNESVNFLVSVRSVDSSEFGVTQFGVGYRVDSGLASPPNSELNNSELKSSELTFIVHSYR